MSGDVQPRKRKDKKKRKDEGDVYGSNEDLTIHVHKDGGTGGNICAKIVFFFLFSALIVLVGLIIKENQGLNELDNIEAESKFSQIFEGWIDKSPDEHEDDHSPELHGHDEEDEHEEDDDHYESEEEDESNLDEDTEEEQSQEVDEDEEEDLEDEDESRARSEEEEEETEEVLQSEEEELTDDKDDTDEVEETAEDDDDDDNEGNQDDEKSEEKDDEPSQEADDKSEEEVATKAESKEGQDNADDTEEETAAPEEESLKDEEGDTVEKAEAEQPKESSGLATKIGVGLALLTVAYNVFLRKRRPDIVEKASSATVEEKEPTPDLSRRNTIVPPPSLQEIEQDLPDIEVDEEEYSEEEYSDEDSRSEHRSAREDYQDLRKTYTRSMTPEGDFAPKDKHFEEDVLDDEIDEEEIEELEEEDDDYDKYDEDEDEELLKRLEAKYGKLGRDVNVGDEPETDSDRDDYEHSNITNKDDYAIKEDIDAAQKQLEQNAAYANKMFEALLDKYPLSPRSLYGKARALDILAEKRQSNELLKKALEYYFKALNAVDVPDQLFIAIADRYINRARFIGQYKKAVGAHWQLIERFPDNATYLNTLAVTYLTINLVEEARSVLKKVLIKWPDDGFALVHYGFILKTADNDLENSVEYMSRGLKTKEPGCIDGRFYFHLGDALTRLNRDQEALKLYEEGVREKVFKSKYQRSLYNIDRLTSKPWWNHTDMPSYQQLFVALRENWQKIREEGLAALNDKGYFQDEAENLKDTGTWKQLELFARGQKSSKNCVKSPATCAIIQKFTDASGCRRGQTKFSVMHPGTHVWPHCGPTNCRLRIHLGLKVPSKTFIRVAEEIRSWIEGDVIIFDDSFEHEVWHNGSDFRLVLIVDVWHPDLTAAEKKSLSAI